MFRARKTKPDDFTTLLDEQGVPIPWEYLERLYAKLAESYEPRPLDSRGVLFRSVSKDGLFRGYNDSLGWKGLFGGGLEIIPVLGDHLSMIRQHHQALAKKMTEVLNGN